MLPLAPLLSMNSDVGTFSPPAFEALGATHLPPL